LQKKKKRVDTKKNRCIMKIVKESQSQNTWRRIWQKTTLNLTGASIMEANENDGFDLS